ncbi:MAG: Sua5/YciO/YrdC/YwlC family protein [Pseudomonadota bacterium]|jgi:L-threonylcarbamoyladenylate synthase|nr:Sua5/YciO/YrdC/YwlC family protein [Pseudomonadota bacterium]
MKGLQQALIELELGGVIAFPTEGVWGIGCDPENELAVKKLIDLKERSVEKGLILVGGSLEQMEKYIDILKYKSRLMTKWPGAHTWVVPTKKAPPWITGKHSSVAVRVSNHPVIFSICKSFGKAIVSSSANFEGSCPARSKEEVQKLFEEIVVIEGSLGTLEGPTPIQEVETGAWIRRGE